MKRTAAGLSCILLCNALWMSGSVAHEAELHAHAEVHQGDGRMPAFYGWTRPVPGHEGRMVASEVLESTLTPTNAGYGWRILYTSKDGLKGEDIVTVSGAVFLPKGKAPEGGWPVIAWAHGTVGIADICAPSLAGRSARDNAYINAWLGAGYAVVASDYQGLGVPGPHHYLNARAQAYGVLDGIRAAQRGFPALSPKTVIVGQSQGGHAAVAAAAYAPVYAAELDIRATVATGTPYRFADPLQMKSGAAAAKAKPGQASDPIVPHMLYALTMSEQADPELKLTEILTAEALPVYEQVRSACISRFEADIRGTLPTRAAAFNSAAYTAALKAVLPQFDYPGLKLKTPLFLGIGGKDAIIPASVQLELARDACAAGTTVVARVYPELSHSGAVNGSLPDSLPFVKAAFAGETIAAQCPKS